LEELAEKCDRTNVPVVMAGDFNLIRGRGDKNNQNLIGGWLTCLMSLLQIIITRVKTVRG
jgi:hypothetical protein